MFIQTEATPNPATLKFLPGRAVLEGSTLDLRDAEQAAQSPLAERLFGITGISGVFFGSDFIAVTKSGGEWQQLKPMILGAIMEHFMSGEPLIARGEAEPSDAGEFFETADAESEREDGDGGESRVAQRETQSIADVGEEHSVLDRHSLSKVPACQLACGSAYCEGAGLSLAISNIVIGKLS